MTQRIHDERPLGHYIDLNARDGNVVRSYVVQPLVPVRAVVVVLQHMDQRMPGWEGRPGRPPVLADSRPGVNPHVRQMAESFAAEGYLAIAPSTFSRGTTGADYGYRFDQTRWGQRLIRPVQPLPTDVVMVDVEAALTHGRRIAPYALIGVVGYCWGGLLAWRAACEFSYLAAAVCHYGGGMEAPGDRARQPMCPSLVHFPTDARWMSGDGIAAFQAAHPPVPGDPRVPQVRVHAGRYGFMQPQHAGFDEALSRQVHAQTLAFLRETLVDKPANSGNGADTGARAG